MAVQTNQRLAVPSQLLDAIRAFPQAREIEHCGRKILISPFDFYATCPSCGTKIKVRSFSGGTEVEDVFDAVFEWMSQPGAEELVKRRQKLIAEESE